jgi:hypothetical protein
LYKSSKESKLLHYIYKIMTEWHDIVMMSLNDVIVMS